MYTENSCLSVGVVISTMTTIHIPEIKLYYVNGSKECSNIFSKQQSHVYVIIK